MACGCLEQAWPLGCSTQHLHHNHWPCPPFPATHVCRPAGDQQAAAGRAALRLRQPAHSFPPAQPSLPNLPYRPQAISKLWLAVLRYDWGSKAARRATAGGAGAVPELQQLLADPHVKVRCAALCCAVLCLVFFACQGLLHVVVAGVRDPYGEWAWAGKRWE